MPIATSLALAVSLSMDSFAAALGKGAVLRRACRMRCASGPRSGRASC